jgi:dienelactone hydrolase
MTNISSADIICANGMPAFVACPDSKGPLPVVILMHERYGLVQHTRDQLCVSAAADTQSALYGVE